ncbi:facilitated trehalose transporter Tret1-2 homolog [Penaeus monodon]|uniref:facilitated trehalose transporter Tret1-2 homolog n=1 Tax=Penaeus monodon TaxID=6687 RepID=UPI0018A7D617|nr:facilitated trehalose transporter Tret1-2 homolog [Penaeus monodon]
MVFSRCQREWRPADPKAEEKPVSGTIKLWPQVLVALTASLAHLSLGTVLAYPAIAVPQLTKPLLPELNRRHNATLRETYNQSQVGEAPPLVYLLDNSTESLDRLNYTLTPSSTPSSRLPRPHEVWLSHSQATWFASVHTTGAIVGSVVCGPLVSVMGQRRAILITSPFILASWLTIWAASLFSLLVSARLVLGICIGVTGTAAQIYNVEIAHESVRGSLTCLTDFFVGLGLLFTYALGMSGLEWRWTAFTLGLVINLPLTIGIAMFPDSPRWLATRGRKEDARKALSFLRGSSYDVSAELENIMKAGNGGSKNTLGQQVRSLKTPGVYMPFLTSCGLFVFTQFSGPYVMYSYTIYIFQAAKVGVSPYLSSVLVGVARVVGSAVGLVVVERAGRRPAMMVGGIGASLSLGCLGFYFFLQNGHGGVRFEQWLPLASMISYTLIVGATISPIPFLLSSELLPLSFRSLGSAVSKIVFYLASMVATCSFPTLKENLGPEVVFWLYAVSALSLVLLVWRTLPETKGRTLEEIEEYYKGLNK